MKYKQPILFVRIKDQLHITDETGNFIDETWKPDANLIFRLKDNQAVAGIIILDDSNDDEVPFDIKTLRKFISKKRLGYVTNAEYEKVRILHASLAGDYPIIGIGPGNLPYLWKENGTEKEGRPEMTLHLFLNRVQEEKTDDGKETTQQDTNPAEKETETPTQPAGDEAGKTDSVTKEDNSDNKLK